MRFRRSQRSTGATSALAKALASLRWDDDEESWIGKVSVGGELGTATVWVGEGGTEAGPTPAEVPEVRAALQRALDGADTWRDIAADEMHETFNNEWNREPGPPETELHASISREEFKARLQLGGVEVTPNQVTITFTTDMFWGHDLNITSWAHGLVEVGL